MRKRILEYLYKHDGYVSLSDFLKNTDEYKIGFDDSQPRSYDPDNSILVAVLELMEIDKVIIIKGDDYKVLKPTSYHIDLKKYDVTQDLSNINFEATITQAGRKEIEEAKAEEIALRVNESIISTNRSVMSTNQSIIDLNRFQRKMSWITAAIAFLAALFALIPLLKKDEISIKNLEPLIQQQKEIKEAIDRIKLELPDTSSKSR